MAMNVNVGCAPLRGAGDNTSRPALLAWDGRLDNRVDLLARLRNSLGHETNNEALVLAAYERWGIPGLRQVIGDWSVVIQDAGSRAVVLASDFAGVRPLYYSRQGETVLWSASLQSLVEATGINAMDEMYIGGFLTLGGYPNRTPYTGIHSVPPGNAVRITATQSTAHSFWSLPTGDVVRYQDERRYEEQLRALFVEAVSVRLQTEGTAVAELSGGLDSSSVVCMASHLIRNGTVLARQLKTVSYVYGGSLDTPFIREVEAFCSLDGVHLSPRANLAVAEDMGCDPMPDAWTTLRRSTTAVARRLGATAMLTGQGGDLVMGNWLDDSLQVTASLRGGIGQAWRDALAWSKVLRVPVAGILVRALRANLPTAFAPSAVYATERGCSAMDEEHSLASRFRKRMGLTETFSLFSEDWKQAPPERRKHFQALTAMRELRTLQVPATMADLDYTHPFVHRPLVEFLMSVPADILCRPGEPRRLMRRALADMWPSKLRTRRSKSLFVAPLTDVLMPLVLRLQRTPRWQVVERGWVDRGSLAGRLDRFIHGVGCNEPQLRQIILLEYWLRARLHEPQDETVLRTA